MAKGVDLKKTGVTKLISTIHYEHQSWGAPKVHREVHSRLSDKSSRYYVPYRDDPKWPRENTISKHLNEIKKEDERGSSESKRLDSLWSRISLAEYEYNIPPDTLPIVMKIWARSIEANRPLTIRQALWVSRLRYVFNEKSKDWLKSLWEAAVTSAYHEKALYRNLGEKDYPETREAILWCWVEDSYLYGQIVGENKAANVVKKMIQEEFGKQFQTKEVN